MFWTQSVGTEKTLIINEPGVYSLVLGSSKPIAEQFARWLFAEVLPAIRKFGCYPVPDTAPRKPARDQSLYDGDRTTIGQRFREERLRWEAEHGRPMAGVISSFSKQVIRAIEDDRGGVKKGKRLELLTYAGFDALYVLTGRRTMTAQGRQLCNDFRIARTAEREALLGRAAVMALIGEREESNSWDR